MSASEIITIDAKSRVLSVSAPTLAEDLPPHVLEGLALRRQTAITGRCPSCGAVVPVPSRAERRRARKVSGDVPTFRVAVRHERDCLAVCEELQRPGWDLLGGRRWSA